MNITPDQASELLDGATPGPWMLDQQDPDEFPMIMSMRVENGLVTGTYIAESVEEDGDARLIAAAPDLAQTVIEQGKRIEELEAQNKALRNTDTSEWGY